MNIPSITPGQSRALLNKQWNLGEQTVRFASKFHMGSEAFVCPLLDDREQEIAVLRFLSERAVIPERIERTSWLIGQQLHHASSVFLTAPYAWATTREFGSPEGIELEFAATLHHVAPGRSWRAIKTASVYAGEPLPSQTQRCAIAKRFVAVLATLESIGPNGFVHGDLSDGNLYIDLATGYCCLIDFDAFVYTSSTTLKAPRLCVGQGGVKGTPGYMPIDLQETSRPEAFPYSDRFARDMLLIELLSYQEGDPFDESPLHWEDRELTQANVAPVAQSLGLTHLSDTAVFSAAEHERPSSKDLAITLHCEMPKLHLNGRGSEQAKSLWEKCYQMLFLKHS
ncbi:hypothetical protein [Aeoliella sp.]|uniref:hypothetical protein n=1 Tax=Aeoliella sp. TaxID=2795800 RepID=UPI003CCC3906